MLTLAFAGDPLCEPVYLGNTPDPSNVLIEPNHGTGPRAESRRLSGRALVFGFDYAKTYRSRQS